MGQRVARLATSGHDQRPHLVPVTPAFLPADQVVIAIDHKPKSTTRLRRLDNIRQNHRVALLWDHYDEDWDQLWWVRADGTARIEESGAAWSAALDALGDRYPQYRTRRPDGPVIMIEVTRWSGWSAHG